MEPRVRASPEQFSLMLDFMERHGDLSRPQPGQQGRIRGEQLWYELAELLNSIDGIGVNKTTEKWKRVWSDWKAKTKKKASIINRDVHGTGGGPARVKALNPHKERIMAIMGITSITGHQTLQEAGFEMPMQSSPPLINVPSPQIDIILQPSLVPDHANYTLAASTAEPPSTPQRSTMTTPVPGPSNRPVQQASRSPTSCLLSPRRSRLRQRRRRLTPFEKATSEFVAIEEGRLQLERERDARLFDLQANQSQIETQRLQIDGFRVEVDRERARVEAERVRIEEEQVRTQRENNTCLNALKESIKELNISVIALQSRLASL